jgi:tellurium resistance protein TerD
MAIEIVKRGQKVDITKGRGRLKRINVALGWDINKKRFSSEDFDLDVSVFMLDHNGICKDDGDVIFFNNLEHASGAVVHSGDERTGATEGDDETISIDFTKMPSYVYRIAFVITIYGAPGNGQNFGQVLNSYCRIDNADNNEPILTFDLGEDFSTETALLVGEVYRENGEWKLNALGKGYIADLGKFVNDYGLEIK